MFSWNAVRSDLIFLGYLQGFRNPAKSDRRFFQTRLKELFAQRVIEKVMIPRRNGRTVPCIRLVAPNDVEQPEGSPEIQG